MKIQTRQSQKLSRLGLAQGQEHRGLAIDGHTIFFPTVKIQGCFQDVARGPHVTHQPGGFEESFAATGLGREATPNLARHLDQEKGQANSQREEVPGHGVGNPSGASESQ